MSDHYVIKRKAEQFMSWRCAAFDRTEGHEQTVDGFEIEFHTIGDLRFYAYEFKTGSWYVNEVKTGLRFASGRSKKQAADKAWEFLSTPSNVDTMRAECVKVLEQRAAKRAQSEPVGASA